MSTRVHIAAAVALMVNAVLFGAGAVTVLSIPVLSENARYLSPAAVAVSFILTPFISWKLAPRLRLRYWNGSAST